MKPKVLLAAIVLLAIAAIIGLKEAQADPNPPEGMAAPSPYPRLWKWCGGKYVIRCHPSGGGECYAEWQELC